MEWISVKERLPKESVDVLLFVIDEMKNKFIICGNVDLTTSEYLGIWRICHPYIEILCCGITIQVCDHSSFMQDGCDVTHWMELPEPPPEK